MDKFETEELRRLMDLRHNIRNISVVSHVDHGKTTLINSLVAAAGRIAQEAAGVETTDPVVPISRFIKTKLTGMFLYYEMDDDCLKSCKEERQGNKYLINLDDCPGNVDFSPEVTTALRNTDAALVVVDCVEGVCVQTETVLQQAVGERVRPVLTINKMDHCFLELKVDGEEAYQIFQRVIETANVTVATYEDPLLGDVQFYPEKETVAFFSGIQGWGITLTTFVRMYALKFGVDESKMMERLWGENFFDTTTKKWSNKNTGSSICKRGSVQFCYEPISDIVNSSMNGHKEKLMATLHKLGVIMKSDTKGLVKWGLMECVIQTWLLATSVLFERILSHLPSPVTAQKYRVENLFNGPLDDKYANAIRNCDPEGPLMLYISNMISSCARGSFFAFGRVFSGKVSTGMKVRIMGPNFVPGQKKDLYIKSVQETLIWMEKTLESVEDVPCGNTVTMHGLDQFITKNATLTNEKESNDCVQCKDAFDLPKLVEGLKLLAKTDPTAVYQVEESGVQTLASTGGLHIDACLEYLQYYMGSPRLRFTDPVVSFCETVFEKSTRSASPSSANKQNRLNMEARPLEEGLAEAIDVGRVGPKDNPKSCAKVLSEEFGWEKNLANKIWCFGPETTGGVQYLNEIKDSVVASFEWASKEGALAGEKTRGACFELFDAKLLHDAIDREGVQIIPTVGRAIHAAQLLSSLRPIELFYMVDTQAPEKAFGDIYNTKAYLPMFESFSWTLSRTISG